MAEKVLICICCPVGCRLTADITGENVSVSGNRCKRGADYAVNELLHPMRTLTTTVRVKEAETLSFRYGQREKFLKKKSGTAWIS